MFHALLGYRSRSSQYYVMFMQVLVVTVVKQNISSLYVHNKIICQVNYLRTMYPRKAFDIPILLNLLSKHEVTILNLFTHTQIFNQFMGRSFHRYNCQHQFIRNISRFSYLIFTTNYIEMDIYYYIYFYRAAFIGDKFEMQI